MKNELKNLYLAVFLSAIAIFFVSRYFGGAEVQNNTAQVIAEPKEESDIKPAEIQEIAKATVEPAATDEILVQNKRIPLKNNDLIGSIRLNGLRIDNLYLAKYKQTIDEDSALVELFAPSGTKTPYYAQFGWLSADKNIKTPDENSVWTAKGGELTPQNPVSFEWNNGQGLRFINKIYLDENYMFRIEQMVENNTEDELELYPYALITKNNKDLVSTTKVVHEGMIGVFDNKLEEIKYADLKEGDKSKTFVGKKSWAGFSDHYWFSAIVADRNLKSTATFRRVSEDVYQTDYRFEGQKIASGASAMSTFSLFAGAKKIKLLDKYVSDGGIEKFDLAVDFGWYYFLTKPFFYILDFLYHLIGNMGWAILLFAALLRLCMFPIANKSFESMSKMRKFQPKIQDLQQRYKDDKARLQQETMALYKKEKINPASGCLPMFIQIPVFFSLYKVLNISIEIRHAPFVGWIKDLSAPDPLVLSELLHIYVPSFLDIGLWPIFMGITMFIQQKLNPAPTNKDQARMFVLMPIIFTFMLGHFASGLVIYWTLSNILGIIQQKAIMYKNGVD